MYELSEPGFGRIGRIGGFIMRYRLPVTSNRQPVTHNE